MQRKRRLLPEGKDESFVQQDKTLQIKIYIAKCSPGVSDEGYIELLEWLNTVEIHIYEQLYTDRSGVQRVFFSTLEKEIKNFILFNNDRLVLVRTYRL